MTPPALYLDTSVVLRAVLETGTTPEVERRIRAARVLVTSRLSLVEAARALLRLRLRPGFSEVRLADAEREIGAIWARCELWEITPSVCDTARQVAPDRPLRALDALHLATFVLARRKLEALELFTVDERLRDAAGVVKPPRSCSSPPPRRSDLTASNLCSLGQRVAARRRGGSGGRWCYSGPRPAPAAATSRWIFSGDKGSSVTVMPGGARASATALARVAVALILPGRRHPSSGRRRKNR